MASLRSATLIKSSSKIIPRQNRIIIRNLTNSTIKLNATAVDSKPIKWLREDVQKIYDSPLMDLIFKAVSYTKIPHQQSKKKNNR